jgi:hypothetical protein
VYETTSPDGSVNQWYLADSLNGKTYPISTCVPLLQQAGVEMDDIWFGTNGWYLAKSLYGSYSVSPQIYSSCDTAVLLTIANQSPDVFVALVYNTNSDYDIDTKNYRCGMTILPNQSCSSLPLACGAYYSAQLSHGANTPTFAILNFYMNSTVTSGGDVVVQKPIWSSAEADAYASPICYGWEASYGESYSGSAMYPICLV